MRRSSAAALGAVLMIATATTAVAQEKGRGDHRGRQDGAQVGADSGYGAARLAPLRGLLRGVNLSDVQKEQVKAVRERYRPQYKALRDSLRPASEQARAARQRGDTAAARAAWAQNVDERRQMMALAQKEAGEIRAILTPDQQRVFDQNLAAWRERGGDAVRDHRRGKNERRGRPGVRQ